MSRMIRVIIQISLYQNKNREEVKIERSGKYLNSLFLTCFLFLFWYKEIWIITLIILLIVYILGKSKQLIFELAGVLPGWCIDTCEAVATECGHLAAQTCNDRYSIRTVNLTTCTTTNDDIEGDNIRWTL